jgi:hypothetical protein
MGFFFDYPGNFLAISTREISWLPPRNFLATPEKFPGYPGNFLATPEKSGKFPGYSWDQYFIIYIYLYL